jgi:hypothetical protein
LSGVRAVLVDRGAGCLGAGVGAGFFGCDGGAGRCALGSVGSCAHAAVEDSANAQITMESGKNRYDMNDRLRR